MFGINNTIIHAKCVLSNQRVPENRMKVYQSLTKRHKALFKKLFKT